MPTTCKAVSNNLEISIIGTGDKANIVNWYAGDQFKVEQLQLSDGTALMASQVDNLVSAMAAFAPPPMGQLTLDQQRADALGSVIAANWN